MSGWLLRLTHAETGVEVGRVIPDIRAPDVGRSADGVDHSQSGGPLGVRPGHVKRQRVVDEELRDD